MAKKGQLRKLARSLKAVSNAKKSSDTKEASQNDQHNQERMTIRHKWVDGIETEIPFRFDFKNDAILLVGEGNFSFSRSLCENYIKVDSETEIIPTIYDSFEEASAKYDNACIQDNLKVLQENNVKIFFGIDGTRLHVKDSGTAKLYKTLENRFISRIVFNYPHTGAGIKDRDRNILAQQRLLHNFFASCQTFLSKQKRKSSRLVKRSALQRNKDAPLKVEGSQENEDDDEDYVYDPSNSHLEPEIHVTIRTGDPYDDWNIRKVGNSAGLKFVESFRFEPSKYPGYNHVKTIGQEEEEDFLKKPAKTFIFKLDK